MWGHWSWGEFSCVMYCLILMISMVIFKLCRNEEKNPLGAQAETKTIPAIHNANEEHFCNCHSKKKTHLVHLKDSTLLDYYPNLAKNFIFMPISVWKLSVKISHMMKLKKRFLKQAKNISTSLQTKKLLKSLQKQDFCTILHYFWTCKNRKIFALVNWFSIVIVIRSHLEKFNKLETFL